MRMRVSKVFDKNEYHYKHPLVKVIINQGGSRSGKTYSILQLLIVIALESEEPLIIDIARKTQAELRATVYTDFLEILQNNDLYNEGAHNKTNLEYRLNGCVFRFIGLDKAQKKRGAKRNILYINEANGLTLEDWVQLSIRCTGKIFIDFNPSEEFWAHTLLMRKKGAALIKSNYKDNIKFLSADTVARIEELQSIDDFYYRVYTLGELAEVQGRILTNFNPATDIISLDDFNSIPCNDEFAGFDDGFSVDPMAFNHMKYWNGCVWLNELFYDTEKFVDKDLIPHLRQVGFSNTIPIYPDPSAARSIREFQLGGFVTMPTDNNIDNGIKALKSVKFKVTRTSINWQKEARQYKWTYNASTGKFIRRPEDRNNHAMDATRYGVYSHYSLKFLFSNF